MHLIRGQKWLLSFSIRQHSFVYIFSCHQLYDIQCVVYIHRVRKRMSNKPVKVQCFLNDVRRTSNQKDKNISLSMTKRTQFAFTISYGCHSLIFLIFARLFRNGIHFGRYLESVCMILFCIATYVCLEMKMFWKSCYSTKEAQRMVCDFWFGTFSLFRHQSLQSCVDEQRRSICSGFCLLFAVYCCCYPIGPVAISCETILLILHEKITIAVIALSDRIESESEEKRIIFPSNIHIYFLYSYMRLRRTYFIDLVLLFCCFFAGKECDVLSPLIVQSGRTHQFQTNWHQANDNARREIQNSKR